MQIERDKIRTPLQDAAKAGLSLGLFFVLKYFCMMYALEYPWLIILYMGGTVAVPFVVFGLTRRYRASLPGAMAFPVSVGWSHGVFLYLFASLIVLIPHYMFYTSILPDQLPLLDKHIGVDPTLYKQMFAPIFGDKMPAEVVRLWLYETTLGEKLWGDFSTNLFWGSLLSLINGFLLRRSS